MGFLGKCRCYHCTIFGFLIAEIHNSNWGIMAVAFMSCYFLSVLFICSFIYLHYLYVSQIRPPFEEHGDVIEVALIKDRKTGQQQGTWEQ